MIDLFGLEGRAALQRLSTRPALYAFDFDGTLAPIVNRPEDARASASTQQHLSDLGAMVPTAILTGRSIDDVRQRIEFTPLHLVGNHGAEGLPDALHRSLADSVTARGGSDADRAIVRRWVAQWPSVLGAPVSAGIVVEPKSLSLSIHYRHAVDHAAAMQAIEAAVARLDPSPRVIGGKCVFNLIPQDAPDKGQALATLVHFERCEAAFFIGDDVTDEAAFVDAPASWITVHVGREGDSAARFFIAEQHDIDRCLELLVANASAAVRERGA